MLTLLLVSMLTIAFDIQPVKAEPRIWTVDDDLQDYPNADFRKIQDAVDAATAGDTIIVYQGTYTENVNVYKRLTIKSQSRAGTTFVQAADPRFNVFKVTADYVTISGFTAKGANYHENGAYYVIAGIYLRDADYCNISSNTASNNNLGIILEYSSNNALSHNSASNIHSGIYLGYSSDNTLIKNNAGSNKEGYGIKLWHSSNNVLNNNYVNSNGMGIWLYELDSSANTLINNLVSNNDIGICLWNSSANAIYHNDFVNNTNQVSTEDSVNVWDDGYPSGGNYWSDYEERYPDAEELDDSGIWDTPYVIAENNRDRYPLMNPWTPTLPTPKITSIDPSQPIVCSGRQWLTILGEGFVLDSEVTLSYGSEIYHVPRDRTWFIGSNKIEVLAGLTVKGQWEVWMVTSPSGSQSNKYAFQVRSFTTEDCEKVAALALQYWDLKNATIMAAIAAAESCLNPNVGGDYGISDFNCSGYASWGLWQIYMKMHLDKLEELGALTDDPYETAKWLIDPNNNVRAAYKVWEEAYKIWGDGFRPWSAYKNREYKKYLGMFERRTLIFKSPVNVTITDNYGRILSENENQIPEASFEYFEMTGSKVFYLPLNLTYVVQLNAIDYGNCTISQITPTESIYETGFSQATFNLTSETMAEFDLLPFNANYTLKVDENGDGLIDYELAPEVETLTTEYDIGITEIVPSKTLIGQGYNLPLNITIMNYGAYTETFNVTLYANETFIASKTLTLASGNSTIVSLVWNTTNFTKGNYTMNAYATPVPGERYTVDNEFIDGWIVIAIPGDINADGIVNIIDIATVARAYGSKPGDPNWNEIADVAEPYGEINILDIAKVAKEYGKTA